MRFVLRMVVAAFTLIGIAYLSGGALLVIEGEGLGEQFLPALFAAVVLAVVNATIRPIVKLISLPVRIVTLGLFGLVINALMFYIVAWVVSGFELVGFWQTLVAAAIMSVVTAVAAKLVDEED